MTYLLATSKQVFKKPVETLKYYGVFEKVGTGAYLPCVEHPNDTPMKPLAEIWLRNRATQFEKAGCEVDRRFLDEGWFVATKEGSPTVFGVIRESVE